MAVGIRMKSSTEGVTSQTLPLIASMMPVTTSPASCVCSCEPSFFAQPSCPGEVTDARVLPSTDDFAKAAFARVGRVFGDRFLQMAEAATEGGNLRLPKIRQKEVQGQSYESIYSQTKLDSTVIVQGPEGEKITKIAWRACKDRLPVHDVERKMVGYAVNRLSNEERKAFFTNLREASDAAGRLEVIGQAVLDYARATATSVHEFEDSVDLYASLTSGAWKIDVSDVQDANNHGQMTITFMGPEGTEPQWVQMVNMKKIQTVLRLGKELQCVSDLEQCPEWIQRLAWATHKENMKPRAISPLTKA